MTSVTSTTSEVDAKDSSRINNQVNIPRLNENIAENNEDDQSKKLSDFHSYLYPMRDIIELDSNKVEQSKRSENYANEVIKQEASVMHSNGGQKTCQNTRGHFLLLMLLGLNVLVWLR